MGAPYTLPAQRAVDGQDLTWAVTLDGTTFLWPGLDTLDWWFTVSTTDEFRTMEGDGYRLRLLPSHDTVLVERVPPGPTKERG